MRNAVLSFTEKGEINENGLPVFPFDHPYYMPSYKAFISLCATVGIDLRIAFADSYNGASTFSTTYKETNGVFTAQTSPFTAEVIIIRGSGIIPVLDGTENVINPPIIFSSEHKFATYTLFKEYMLKTLTLDPVRWKSQLQEIPGENIVCKPVDAWGGKDVWIGKKEAFILPDKATKQSHILQEYLDTSQGIPGLVSGVHDLRIIVSGNHPPISYIRSPKVGSLLANLSQGGSAIPLEYSQIPESALYIAHEIEKKLVPGLPHFRSTWSTARTAAAI